MAVHGYVTHAARNRRFVFLLALIYILAFELIGAFAFVLPLLIYDPEHTILSNPAGYLLRYAFPLAAFSAFLFWRIYRGHAKSITRSLNVAIVTRQEEPRFVAIAEEVCTTLGIRAPRFGVIEQAQPNAVTAGEGPNCGVIAATRGLLDQLDDDELAAVLAHEASHIRQGDTRALAANHAMMRTAVMLQTHNPLRIEDWRQMSIPLALPPMLLILLASGAATMIALQLSRFARRGIKLGRDHVADGEAIRVTHFPEALLSALQKVGGKGAFAGSWRVEGMLFDGPADHEGGTHPAVDDRLRAVAALGHELMNPARRRRDTREAMHGRVRRPRTLRQGEFQYDQEGRPIGQEPERSLRALALFFTDRRAFWEWQHASVAWQEWRVSDQRNLVGLTPRMAIPVIAVTGLLLVLHWPADRDLSKLAAIFNPGKMANLAHEVNSGPFCAGPSFRDGKCPGHENNGAAAGFASIAAALPLRGAVMSEPSTPPGAFTGMIGILPMLLVAIHWFRPQWLRALTRGRSR